MTDQHERQLSQEERLVVGLLQRLRDVAYLAGSSWPELAWKLRDLIQALMREVDTQTRERISDEIQSCLEKSIPGVRIEWLTKYLDSAGPDGHRGIGFFGEKLSELLRQYLDPPEVRFEVKLSCPDKIEKGTRSYVILDFLPLDADSGNDALAVPEKTTVIVLVRGFGIGVDEQEHTVTIKRKALPCSVRLGILGTKPGTGTLVVDIWQERELLKVIKFEFKVVKILEEQNTPTSMSFFITMGGCAAPEPGLRIRVSRGQDQIEISMDFDNSEGHVTKATLSLESDPADYWRRLRQELESLGSDELAISELERIGERLYNTFWPPELDSALWSVIDQGVGAIQIDSDEPWIPWELMRPYRRDRDVEEQKLEFLCQRFDMARWYHAKKSTRPRCAFEIDHLGIVIPNDHGLPSVSREQDMLMDLARSRSIHLSSVAPANRETTLEALGSRSSPPVVMWHFAGHGNLDFEDPDRASMWLEQGTQIRPNDFQSRLEPRLRQSRPYVFLNACRVGHGGRSLTGMGGWASQLVGNCGIGALIAPLWAVSDEAAFAFAKAFYELLPSRSEDSVMTVARAVRFAREIIRNRFPNDPTWLAYALFAHPNARISTNREHQ